MGASVNGHAEVVDTLLQHGARVDLKKEVNLFTKKNDKRHGGYSELIIL